MTRSDVATIDANLAITKTSSPADAVPGAAITYVITVSNLGPSPVFSATVYDDLSSILEEKPKVKWACTHSQGDPCEKPNKARRVLDVEVTVPASGWVVYTATGELQSAITETVVNTATVTAPPGLPTRI